MMAYKICPRCFKGRPYNEACKTPACVELQKSPTYLRDEIEGEIHICRAMIAEGNTEANWKAELMELEQNLVQYAAHHGAAAFKQ